MCYTFNALYFSSLKPSFRIQQEKMEKVRINAYNKYVIIEV